MHEFKHPKYYTELRKLRNKSDQAISNAEATAASERATDPGHKLDVPAPAGPSVKPQASSSKPQASSSKRVKHQAASVKPQATSVKLQATSVKLQDS